MSHSPGESDSESARKEYIDRWKGLTQFLREGRLFSRNERNCCFLNTGQTRFADISAVSGLDLADDGRAVLPVDWDFDGDLDLWLFGRTAPRLRLMENRLDQQGHFLALRLEGRAANRDAIGARVELHFDNQPDQPPIKTVRAGDGFASQGSKWLHFGLGTSAAVDRVVVRWPGGAVQTLRGFSPNRWYRIIQAQEQPIPWAPPLSTTESAIGESAIGGLAARVPPASTETTAISEETRNGHQLDSEDQTRPIVLPNPIPMPQLRYIASDGASTTLDYQHAGATLINLWATWCAPCAEELSRFGAAQQTIRDNKLQIVAIHVDGLRGSGQGNPETADAMLDRLGYPNGHGPCKRGRATEALMTKLQLLQSQMAESDPSLIMPTSFLVNRDGSLVAVYRGPVNIDHLVKDVEKRLGRSTDDQQAVGMFPGRWLLSPNDWELFARLGESFRINGMLPEALLYFSRAHQLRPEHAYISQQNEQIAEQLQAVRRMLNRCQELLRVNPDHSDALARIGIAYQALGDHQLAVHHLRRAIETGGNGSQNYTALGVSLAYLGELEQAKRQFRKAVDLDPGNQQAQQNLEQFAVREGRRR